MILNYVPPSMKMCVQESEILISDFVSLVSLLTFLGDLISGCCLLLSVLSISARSCFSRFVECNFHQLQTSFELLNLTVPLAHLQTEDHSPVLHQLRYFGHRSLRQHVHDGCDLRTERGRERHPAEREKTLKRSLFPALTNS